MRSICKLSTVLLIVGIMASCKKEAQNEIVQQDEISKDVLNKIHALGFSTKNVIKDNQGYLVEGDIYFSDKDLDNAPANALLLRVGKEEQYRTYNIVRRLPRLITISMSSSLPGSYVAALDEAINRYNALGLRIGFARVSWGANISFIRGSGPFLASGGFPDFNGNPYPQVRVNVNAIGFEPQSTIATIFAHEIGHCIGFRHTDYMNRAYSCGGQPVNEGASTIGAVWIPGTPVGIDPTSWMLACIGSGQNRSFNANDRAALNYLYR